MSIKEINDTINQIIKDYNVHTIFLYGSRASGEYRDNSDYDLFCIRKDGPRVRKVFNNAGNNIDLIVDDEKILDRPDDFLFLWSSQIILDKNNFANTILNTHQKHLKNGAPLLGGERLTQRKKNVFDILEYINSDSIISNFRKADLLSKLLPLYFSIIGEWYLGDKHAFNWLKNNRFDIYKKYQIALEKEASYKDICNLVDSIFS